MLAGVETRLWITFVLWKITPSFLNLNSDKTSFLDKYNFYFLCLINVQK
jgi:hypothetical protein